MKLGRNQFAPVVTIIFLILMGMGVSAQETLREIPGPLIKFEQLSGLSSDGLMMVIYKYVYSAAKDSSSYKGYGESGSIVYADLSGVKWENKENVEAECSRMLDALKKAGKGCATMQIRYLVAFEERREYHNNICTQVYLVPGATIRDIAWMLKDSTDSSAGPGSDTGGPGGTPKGAREGTIRDVTSQWVTISIGSNNGVKMGDRIEIFKRDEVLGTAEIIEIRENSSRAKIIDKKKDFVPGNQVRVVERKE